MKTVLCLFYEDWNSDKKSEVTRTLPECADVYSCQAQDGAFVMHMDSTSWHLSAWMWKHFGNHCFLDIRSSTALKFPNLRPFVLRVWATCRQRWVGRNGGLILAGGNRSTGRKTCPWATLSTANLTETGLESNPGVRCERPTTNSANQFRLLAHSNSFPTSQ
jgi:hypothetical protein